jgi:DNA-binding MarR family transcriptional regulator
MARSCRLPAVWQYAVRSRAVSPDHVDRIVEQWARERPDLDASPIRVIGRISRLSRSIDRQLRTVFDRHHLEAWEYDVLASLRRAGAPYELIAGDLLNALMITSGAVTNRIDRLERRGLVKRGKRDEDRRFVLVRLTDAGLRLIEEAAPAHLDNERAILAPLDADELAQLEELLRRLQAGLGDGAASER